LENGSPTAHYTLGHTDEGAGGVVHGCGFEGTIRFSHAVRII